MRKKKLNLVPGDLVATARSRLPDGTFYRQFGMLIEIDMSMQGTTVPEFAWYKVIWFEDLNTIDRWGFANVLPSTVPNWDSPSYYRYVTMVNLRNEYLNWEKTKDYEECKAY